jgi:DNA-binding NarL/FixJ family response regulator
VIALQITPQECLTLELLAAGKSDSEIAAYLGTTEPELASSLEALFARMGVTTRGQAMNDAARRGLLPHGDGRVYGPDSPRAVWDLR